MPDPNDHIQIRRLKLLLLIAALVSLLFLLLAAFEENLAGGWRAHQRAYRSALAARAATPEARGAAEAMAVSYRQQFLPDLQRIDRCVTCHIGIEDPAQAEAEQPLRAHAGAAADIFTHHPVDKFGCTVCHDGQGRAIGKDDAHGEVAHWAQPLLRGRAVYTSCGRCHYENDLFGAEDDLYARPGAAARVPIDAAELHRVVPGSQRAGIDRGKQLVVHAGCLGCHAYRGRGGTLGPDITNIGDRTVHDFDFHHVAGEHTVANWLLEHFMQPARVSPGTLMPAMGLSREQAEDLTRYMLSLHRKSMPAAYTPIPPRRSGAAASGAQLYAMFCSACHGPDGRGSTVREANVAAAIDAPPQLMVPSLNHPDTLAVASDDYLWQVIARGRPHTSMIGWLGAGYAESGAGAGATAGGLHPDEIDRLVAHIRSWQSDGPDLAEVDARRGDARAGAVYYRHQCTACHGPDGRGGIGTTLNAPSFLAVASDPYLARTIVAGRPDTAMSAYAHLSAAQLNDLLAHLRSWHPLASRRGDVLARRAAPEDATASAAIGRTLFAANCATCHGRDGFGDHGPSINAQEFLTLVDDGYLYDAVTQGRPTTGMPAWRHLSTEDVASLIMHMRSWQTRPSRDLPEGRIVGDPEAGRLVYLRACAACHGQEAEGAVGTQLRNAAFLRSARDATLKEWIAYGKTGTVMLGFLRGQQGPVELNEPQIDNVVSYLRSLERSPQTVVARSPSGRPELGAGWYANACAGCHGEHGEGASGPSLSNPAFLAAASDGFLMATLALGRDGTEMRPVKGGPQSILDLDSDQLNDLVAFMRSWETEPPFGLATARLAGADAAEARFGAVPHRYVIPWDLARGRRLYASNCAGCHGVHGRAELIEPGLSAWAPRLNNAGFLAAATDGFLQATIVRGRAGTAMRPFGFGRQGLADLKAQEIDDIVAYIRRWSDVPAPTTLPAERSLASAAPSAETASGRGAAAHGPASPSP